MHRLVRRRLADCRALAAWACLAAATACNFGTGGARDADDAKPVAAAKPPSTDAGSGLTLSAEARQRAGIKIRRIAPTVAGTMVLTGTLIADPSRITTIEAPIAGRLTAIDGGHWPAFGERVPAGMVLAQVSDAKPLVTDRGGTVTRVGAQPGQVVQPGRLLLEITDVGELLARIVWRPDAPESAPAMIQLSPLASAGAPAAMATARLVGLATDADSLTRLPVYLYRTSHTWRGAGPGTPVQATIGARGATARGLFVPTAAVVQWEGLAWTYVERPTPTDQGQRFAYVRVRVETSQPVVGGWLVAATPRAGTLAAGDAIVVEGAQQLLSEEFRSRATTGDDNQE